jgi:indole-3-glycerol phosphate synthase
MIISQIIENKRIEVDKAKAKKPLAEILKEIKDIRLANHFKKNISRPHHINLIAEAKKASPSRGVIREDFQPCKIAAAYQANGAQAISVLTDEKFFQGKLEYIKKIKECASLPVLRKDFIIDEYQIFESILAGADAILLISELLSEGELKRFHEVASSFCLDVLVESHSEEDIDKALKCGASIIGINNRDLHTFKVDLGVTQRLIKRIPAHKTIVSESGIKTYEDVMFLKSLGVNALLIGETFMESADIAAKMRELFR